MTIALHTASGIFTRLGHIFGALQDLDAIKGGTATARVLSTASFDTRRNTYFTDYTASTALDRVLNGVQGNFDAWKSAQSGFYNSMISLAQTTLIEMANDDTPLPSKSVKEAMTLLINQMIGASKSVNASTLSVGAQTALTGVTPQGNPQIVVSVIGGDGKNLDYCFGETLIFTVTADATNPQGGGAATEGYEPYSVVGKNAVSLDSELWPAGSGASITVNGCDPEYDNNNGNLLYNADFEVYTTTDYPDDWVIATGTVTTHVAKNTSVYRTGGDGVASVSFIGDAATLIAIQQSFNTAHSTTAAAGGTPAKLKSRTPYACGFWSKVSNNAATGVLAVSLVDGSGNVINDDNGTANTISVTVDNETTSWAFHSGVFRLPSLIPSTVKIRMKMTTALSAHTLYIDDMAMCEMKQIYAGGPFAAVFSDPTDQAVKGDAWTVAVTNTRGVIQSFFDRVFGMRALGLTLPYDTGGSETELDSLVA